MRLPFLPALALSLLLSGCVKPEGEWRVTEGSDFHDKNLEKIEKGATTAGGVIQQLGVPLRSKDNEFVYAVRRVRPVARDFVLFSRPFTEEVTLQTKIFFDDGVVGYIDNQRYERLLPRASAK